MNKEEVKRQKAYITGASKGIGAEFTRKLAPEYDLVIISRQEDALNLLAKELVTKYPDTIIETIGLDLTDPKALFNLEEKIRQEKNLGLLINNAGFGSMNPFALSDIENESLQIDLNVRALTRLSHAAIHNFLARKVSGKLINVSSVMAYMPAPGMATYAATKAYVKSFTEALFEELHKTGLYIQLLCPGATKTDFQKRAGMDLSTMPDFFVMNAEEVVKESLEAMKKKEFLCIPGLMNRSTATVLNMLPSELTRKITGFFEGHK